LFIHLASGCASEGPALDPSLLGDADIVIIGEVHDNPEHHRRQAGLIAALSPAAVAFEMLSPEQARTVNSISGRQDDLAEALAWSTSGWPEWSLYQPLFEAAGSARIYGMALPTDAVNAAVVEGAAAIFGKDAGRFGLSQPLPPAEQAAREAHQQAAHCGMLPDSLLPGMVEAQRLRDAAFARTALQALADTGGPVAVITGSGHARLDWGMPAALRRAAPKLRFISIGQLEAPAEEGVPFDYRLIAAPAPREDPCDGLEASDFR
jgi:uncharacterized iron-regulated protein